MGNLFNFSPEEIYTFFAVLIRVSVLIAVLPVFGDKLIPAPVKILLSLAITLAIFPGLLKQGFVRPGDAAIWAASTWGILRTIGQEVLVALALGFTAKLVFDAIQIGANLASNMMGFSMASVYDPHHETQTTVVAEIQVAIAMLAFLALDGHHLLLHGALDSFRFCGIGEAGATALMQTRLIEMTATVLKFGIQLGAPITLVMFAVNVAFGVFSKTMPQMNVLVLSLGISAFAGIIVLMLTAPEFQTVAANVMSRTEDWMQGMLVAMAGR
ncbi:MAG: flagellar biosynthetic protein FliR [Bdellovibrionales bacterium]|nr:flagellar biosynthetic protein FliR [Bdellovibrionales bacterium]